MLISVSAIATNCFISIVEFIYIAKSMVLIAKIRSSNTILALLIAKIYILAIKNVQFRIQNEIIFKQLCFCLPPIQCEKRKCFV